MNLLDRAIAVISPQAALDRVRARAQIAVVAKNTRGYEAASRTSRTQRWSAGARGPVLEIQAARALVRDRARDLVRNNAWAGRGLDVIVANHVGTGIRPRANSGNPALDKTINEAWKRWEEYASPTSDLDVYGVQALAARTRSESGETLILMPPSNPRPGIVPLQLQVLEPDWLVEDHSASVMPSSPVREGIRFNEDGTRLAYQLYRFNPNDFWQAGRNDWREVPAGHIAHLYRVDRPGQLRGISDFARVMLRLRDLDEYHDAALMAAKIQALLGVFVTQNGGPAGSTLGAASTDAAGDRLEELTPGMIGYLRPGEDIKFMAPENQGPFDAYTKVMLRAIAGGLGLTYHQLASDLSDANYSSLRAGTNEFRLKVEQDQWLTLIPKLCNPIWNRFIAQGILSGILPTQAENCLANWAPPRAQMVDPNRDTLALVAQVRAGLKTMQQAISEMGWDPHEQVAEIAKFNALVDQSGVILDTDPRRITGAGAPNDPKQLAAIELGTKGTANA